MWRIHTESALSHRNRGQKSRTRKKTNSWERRFPGTFRTNVPFILPIFCLFSGRRAKSSQELCSWELFFDFRWFFSFRRKLHSWNGLAYQLRLATCVTVLKFKRARHFETTVPAQLLQESNRYGGLKFACCDTCFLSRPFHSMHEVAMTFVPHVPHCAKNATADRKQLAHTFTLSQFLVRNR